MASHQQVVTSGDQNGAIRTRGNKRYRKVYCASGYNQYQTYVVDYDGSPTGCPNITAAAALAVGREVVVFDQASTTAAGWYWGQLEGKTVAYVDGTADVAAKAFLKVTSTTTFGFYLDHATDQSTASAATIDATCATDGTANTCAVRLLGTRAMIL
jgi:hypothetical protein